MQSYIQGANLDWNAFNFGNNFGDAFGKVCTASWDPQ
jgi:hypothetical protein